MHPHMNHLVRNISKSLIVLIGFTPILLFCTPVPSFADGMAIVIDRYADRFDYANETMQNAYISYENGLENLIISVGFDQEAEDELVWIFPVPAEPENVSLDILKEVPVLTGQELLSKAKSNVDEIGDFLQITQLYTLLFRPYLMSKGGDTLSMDYGPNFRGEYFEELPEVVIHEHIEKEGITSELITARTADGLFDYLSDKGLNIDTGTIPVLDHYIGSEYSFVVSWITNPDAAPSSEVTSLGYDRSQPQRGVFVSFPTDDLYFPLLPTSVYGAESVPVIIRVLGHVTPKSFQGIRKYVTTEYFINGNLMTEGLEDFYSGPVDDIEYTKIRIFAPSELLTEDLWISRSAPAITNYYSMFAKSPILLGIILLILCSIITGIIVGWIVFPERRKKILSLALIGLANCLTILGLIVAMVFTRLQEIPQATDELLAEVDKRGYRSKRILGSIFFGISIPFLFLGFVVLPITEGAHINFSFTAVIILYVLPVIVFMLALDKMRVRQEDKELFRELKAKGGSTGYMYPVTIRKLFYVPFFSIVFLLISTVLEALLQATL